MNYSKDKQWLLEEKFGGKETAEFFEDVTRLEAGEPVAYLIGHTPFLGVSVDLSTHPLIPRPETEYWVDHVLAQIVLNPGLAHIRVLDLFAGSGAIGAAVLKHFPTFNVDFGDIDATLLSGICTTLKKNNLEGRSQFFETDVWNAVPVDTRYNYVFANPPYLSKSRTERIGENVLAHEPHLALFANDDGMELIRRTVLGAPAHLLSGGTLFLEHDDWQKEHAQQLFAQAGFSHITTMNDQYGVPRMTQGTFHSA